MAIPAPFSRYQPELESELHQVIGESDLLLYTMMRYHLGWTDREGRTGVSATKKGNSRGKRLRPTLCLLAGESVSGEWRKFLPAAAAVELMHNFTLIHDDIQDRSSARRHRPTVWWVWGLAQGINAGDAMYALTQLTLSRLENGGIPAKKIITSSRILNETCLHLCEGQFLDISYENRLDLTLSDYLDMIDKKTAQLFQCSLQLGALLGTEDETLIQQLGLLGRELGIAFQVQDDIMGIWGKEKDTGKPVSSDIWQRKKTPPIIYILNQRESEASRKLADIYRQEELSQEDVSIVRDILDSSQARQHTERLRDQHYERALKWLEGAELKSAKLPHQRKCYEKRKKELREVAEFLIKGAPTPSPPGGGL